MAGAERLSHSWPFLKAWGAIALGAGLLTGCTFNMGVDEPENNFSVTFRNPTRMDYSTNGTYSFRWNELTAKSSSDRPLPSKKYLLSIFAGPDCVPPALKKVDVSNTLYVYDGFVDQGQQISVGLQIRDGWGLLGPMTCSAVVELDSNPPNLTETSPAFTSDTLVTLTGSCEAGLPIFIEGTGLDQPAFQIACPAGAYSVDVDLSGGTGAKNLRLTQTDPAGNQAVVDIIKTLVLPPSGFSYDQLTYYFPQGFPIADELPQISGDVIEYSGDLPDGLSLDPATGRISGTPTTLGSDSITVTATGPAGDSVQTTFTIEVYYGPTTVTDSTTGYSQIAKQIPIADILGNDIEPSGLTISFVEVAGATGGTASVVGANIVYTSTLTAGQTGTVTYVAQNSLGQTKEGTIEIEILPTPPPDAVDDGGLNLVQAETLQIHRNTLLANDTTLAGTEPLSVISVSNAVGGTVSYNATTGWITFQSTGFVGDPAGFDYTIQHAFGGTDTAHVTITILQLPAISALVYGTGDTAAMNAKLAGYSPPSMEDIFSEWGRFAGADWYPSGTTPAGEAASWELLANPYRVSCQVNSANYTGFVSSEALDYYTHETVLGSVGTTDDDAITVIMAYVHDGTDSHVLAAFRTQGGIGSQPTGWGISYFKNNAQVLNVAQGNGGPFYLSPDGWNGRMARVRVERTGDTFKAYTSHFSTDEGNLPLEPSSLIEVDLNSNPLLAIFKGPKPYGYGSYSQANSFFNQAQIVGGLDPQFIYDLVNNRVYAYDNSLGYVIVNGIDPYDHLGYPREVTNPDTGKTFMLNRNKTYTLQP